MERPSDSDAAVVVFQRHHKVPEMWIIWASALKTLDLTCATLFKPRHSPFSRTRSYLLHLKANSGRASFRIKWPLSALVERGGAGCFRITGSIASLQSGSADWPGISYGLCSPESWAMLWPRHKCREKREIEMLALVKSFHPDEHGVSYVPNEYLRKNANQAGKKIWITISSLMLYGPLFNLLVLMFHRLALV